MKKKLIVFGGLTVLVGLFVFFTAPNLNPIYSDGAFFWLILITLYTAVALVMGFKMPKLTFDEGTVPKPHISFEGGEGKKTPKKWIFFVIGGLWLIYLLVFLIFNPVFFWGSYRDQMSDFEVKEFSSDIQAVDLTQVPVVDEELAAILADKKLGERPALGSQVTLGTPTIQNYNGELVWVVPLQHSGIFKWFDNMEGSPGYIVVSATDLSEIDYVDSYNIKIQPSTAYFMDDLNRTVRFKGGLFTGITDYSFEIDDNGTPYWIVTTYQNKCGFSLPEASGIILVDAQTGNTQNYDMDNIPEWVDRVQPEDFISTQINNKGEYIHGIFNFSNREKFSTSAGHNIVYNNGHCYYFSGITSVGVDESATGFIMVDMVTKQPTLYRMSGATESAAMNSAEGKVQDLGYSATQPIIINVNSQPTYFMTLKDSAQLIKKYAFVNIKDYMIVGVGDTSAAAMDDYLKSLSNIGNKVDVDDKTESVYETAEGTISRIDSAVVDGKTIYTFTLNEHANVFYNADYSLSSSLPITRAGDKVEIKYLSSEGTVISISAFENKSVFESIVTE